MIQQALVVNNDDNNNNNNNNNNKKDKHSSFLTETFQPLSDPLLSSILKDVPSYIRSDGKPTWIPTVTCGVIQRLYQDRPHAHLLLADFDYLPPPVLPPLKNDPLHDDDDGDGDGGGGEGDESSSHHHRRRHRRSIKAENEPLVTDMKDQDYNCYISTPRTIVIYIISHQF